MSADRAKAHTDRLIHAFHCELVQDPVRSVGVNLIYGKNTREVTEFLDRLTYGEASTPELKETRAAWERTAVDGDDVALGIGQRGELTGHGAVDGDATVGDELVSPAAGRQSRLRQDLVESQLRHGSRPPRPARVPARESPARPRSSAGRSCRADRMPP